MKCATAAGQSRITCANSARLTKLATRVSTTADRSRFKTDISTCSMKRTASANSVTRNANSDAPDP